MSDKKRFKDLIVGTKFIAYNRRFVKISEDSTHGKKLSRCKANAINSENGHRCVIGDNVLVEIDY